MQGTRGTKTAVSDHLELSVQWGGFILLSGNKMSELGIQWIPTGKEENVGENQMKHPLRRESLFFREYLFSL